jgi:uncharacterized repeat protein (TIGR03803 family)
LLAVPFAASAWASSNAPASYALRTLASFNGVNGENPNSSLSFDSAGNIYGTAQNGGSSNDGAVFEIAAQAGALSTVAAFNGSNGSGPEGVYIDGSCNMFGTTYNGGASNDGTVFEVAATGHLLSTLHSFSATNQVNDGNSDGALPQAVQSLVADPSGNLYGVTSRGGSTGQGTLFEISAGTHTFAVVTNFSGSVGGIPSGGLSIDSKGDLFGTTTTLDGGNSGGLFQLSAGMSTPILLASFPGYPEYSRAPLYIDANGNLLGTCPQYGTSGLVYELSSGAASLSNVAAFNGTRRAASASQRPRNSIHQRGLHASSTIAWLAAQHERQGQLLGQRSDGKLLGNVEDGAGSPRAVRQSRPGQSIHL